MASYLATTGPHVVQAVADAFPAGRWYLVNPLGSGKTVVFSDIRFTSQIGSAMLVPASPRIALAKATFTGTASGATVPIVVSNSVNPAPVASLRSASTGLTLVKVGDIRAFFPVASASAASFTPPNSEPFTPQELLLAPGEALVAYQPDAGTAADTRRYVFNLEWSEQ